MSLNVVQFPEHHAALDIPAALRTLADNIEAGDHGDCHTLLWIIDAGDGRIDIGLMGKAGESGITAHYLAAAAQKRMLSGVGE